MNSKLFQLFIVVIVIISLIVPGGSTLAAPAGTGSARSLPAGSLDTSFDSDGKVTADFNTVDRGTSISIQSDGKIILVGASSDGASSDFALARYNRNGSLDTTFSLDGKVTTDFGGGSDDLGVSGAIQSDGKIIVVGHTFANPDYDFALARYNSDGSLDTTFGTGGKVVTDLSSSGTTNEYAVSVIIQPDGKVVVGGTQANGNISYFALARYNNDGSLDPTFGDSGKVIEDFNQMGVYGGVLALLSNGQILLAGTNLKYPSDYDFALARFNSNGSLDTTFGNGAGGGKVNTNVLGPMDYGNAIAVQPDGRIVVAGASLQNGIPYAALVRYTAGGLLDTTFSVDGKLTSTFNGNYFFGNAVAIQPDGKILLGGYVWDGTSEYSENFALERYNANGTLDTTFDTDGRVTADFGASDQAASLAIQSDGRILMAGSTGMPGVGFDFALARYLGDHSPVIYVKQGATGANNGSSWANAFTDLQSALAAAESGDQIWVAAGTYMPTADSDRTISFALKNGVAIYGGFAGTETALDQRDPAANVTILSGDLNGDDEANFANNSENSYHVVVGSGTDNSAVLDGFTITAGNASASDYSSSDSSGGGMYTYIGSPTIGNVIFNGNAAFGWGGGMYNGGETPTPTQPPATTGNGSHPILTNVIFSNNSARNGGGMENQNYSNPVLTNVIFTGNTASRVGGGMENYYFSNPTLMNVVFDKNTAGVGGGMTNTGSHPTLTNVTFSANSAEWGGAMANGYGSPVITNATFYGNSADTYGGAISNESYSYPVLTNVTINGNTATTYGGGISNDATSGSTDKGSTTILNGILYGNTGGEIYNASTPASVTYSIIQGGYTGTGNLDVDPLLGALQDNGGFTQTLALGADSPAIDAGTDTGCPTTDQRGVSRPQGARCDMGAVEYTDAAPPTVSSSQIADADPAAAGSLVHFTVTFSEKVTGVDAGDFTLTATGVTGATVTGVSGSEAVYTVTVNTGTVGAVNGTVRLNVVDNDSIRDLYNNPLGGTGAGNGSFTTGEFYTIAAHVGTPSLLSPARNYITNQSPLTFNWSPVTDAARYEIVFAEDSGFNHNPASHSVTDPTFAGSLPEGKSYWRVRAYNALDEPGNWSTYRSFSLDTTGPAAPTLRSPADAATVRNVPIFRWNAVGDAVLYEFQLDNDSDFSSPLVAVEQRSTSRKPAGGLRGTYSWRVRARDAAGNWGAWSSVFTVTIVRAR